MAQRSHVPKFGNWESEENVPYTAYFDKARKGKTGGKMINPNDPQENPDAFTDDATPVPLRAASDPGVPPPEASKPKHERRSSKEDAELRRQTDSPAARHDPGARRGSSDLSHLRHGDRGVNSSDTPKKANRISGGSDRSTEHSPLHPTYQAKVASKGGVSSPSWERKGASEGSHGLAPNTPGRSRLRNAARGDETPEKGAAVPKFGDWDETNPSSADGYTHIFNKVREEKQIGAAKVPVMPTDSSYNNNHRQDNARNSETTMCWCFPMSRK